MKPDEIRLMAELEADHWWYRGLRDLLVRLLGNGRHAVPRGGRVLDAGCGTGENLRLLDGLLAPSYLGGFDVSPLALEHARAKAPAADLYRSDLRDPEQRDGPFDLILSCDVLYIPGAHEAREGMARLARELAPGGRLLLHLPAYQWLYSEHDVAVGTRERYTVSRVRQLLRDLDLVPDLVSYRCSLLFPAIALARLPSMLGRTPDPARARSDLRLPGPRTNELLTALVRAESRALAAGLRLPFGSSVVALGRRAS